MEFHAEGFHLILPSIMSVCELAFGIVLVKTWLVFENRDE
jgi:hypothetical protein